MTNKIHFTLIEQNERTRNGTHELWERWQVPEWIAQRAEALTDKPEGWVLATDKGTVTFCYATGNDLPGGDWDDCLDGAWSMFLCALGLSGREIVVHHNE